MGRGELASRVGESRAGVRKRERGACERASDDDRQPPHVVERQVEQPAVAGTEREARGQPARARDVLPPGLEHRFGGARRARRVEDGERVARVDPVGRRSVQRGVGGGEVSQAERAGRRTVGGDGPHPEPVEGLGAHRRGPARGHRRERAPGAEGRQDEDHEVGLVTRDDAEASRRQPAQACGAGGDARLEVAPGPRLRRRHERGRVGLATGPVPDGVGRGHGSSGPSRSATGRANRPGTSMRARSSGRRSSRTSAASQR